MKKLIIIFCVFFSFNLIVKAEQVSISAPSAILMDSNGEILFEKDADERLAPASMTNIMTT